MLKIRLQRIGRKNDPSFRMVVVDSRQGPKAGKFTDIVGTHNPKQNVTQIDGEKVKMWLSKGAQASDTVHNMLVSKKIIDAKKINVLPKMKNRKVVEEVKSEEKKEKINEEAPATEVEISAEASVTAKETSAA